MQPSRMLTVYQSESVATNFQFGSTSSGKFSSPARYGRFDLRQDSMTSTFRIPPLFGNPVGGLAGHRRPLAPQGAWLSASS